MMIYFWPWPWPRGMPSNAANYSFGFEPAAPPAWAEALGVPWPPKIGGKAGRAGIGREKMTPWACGESLRALF